MPTFVKAVENSRGLIQVTAKVGPDGSVADNRFAALVAPGLSTTAVTSRLAQQVGAVPVGRRSFMPPALVSMSNWFNKSGGGNGPA